MFWPIRFTGVSFFSPRNGFVCDNVLSSEVVLDNGEFLHANTNEKSDLRIDLLKGGSSNLGIVAHFTMQVFPASQIWGGIIRYNISTAPQQLQAFSNFLGANRTMSSQR